VGKKNKRGRGQQPLRQLNEVPLLVERTQQAEQHHEIGSGESQVPPGKTYEEFRWAYLSPLFREAHNKRLIAKGLSPIPPPKVDLYVAPKQPLIKPFNENDPEFVAATREFLGGTMGIAAGGDEGFSIGGEMQQEGRRRPAATEGFTVNGKRV
jgi:hypothetical protein